MEFDNVIFWAADRAGIHHIFDQLVFEADFPAS
jgi:hypothetical protein